MMIIALLFLSTLHASILTVSANVVVVTISNITECTFSSYGASFGPQLDPDEKIRGFMRVAEPPDACKPIKKAPKHTEAPLQLPYFALIARSPGSCNFDVKVFHAQQAGFAAAVVHNIPGHDEIFVMHANSQLNITIPSQFIGFQDSLTLTSFITSNFMYTVVLNGHEPSFPQPYFYIIPFFVVVCIIIVILITALIVKLCREYFHTRRSRLSKRHLKKLPTKKFVKNADPFETCAICLDDFEEGDKIRILPCNHAYHCICIDPWLLKQKRCCPVCKRKIRFGRRRRDPPTAAPDSSDSDQPDTGDERTPLLAAPSSPDAAASTVTSGVINGDQTRESAQPSVPSSRLARLMAALFASWRPRSSGFDEAVGSSNVAVAGYGSFEPAQAPPVGSVTSSHVVEVHASREQEPDLAVV